MVTMYFPIVLKGSRKNQFGNFDLILENFLNAVVLCQIIGQCWGIEGQYLRACKARRKVLLPNSDDQCGSVPSISVAVVLISILFFGNTTKIWKSSLCVNKENSKIILRYSLKVPISILPNGNLALWETMVLMEICWKGMWVNVQEAV